MSRIAILALSTLALLADLGGAQTRDQYLSSGARSSSGTATEGAQRALSVEPEGNGASSLAGTWEGRYVCGQGATGGRFVLAARSATSFDGRFEFFPVPENPGVPSGGFKVTATLDPRSQAVVITPGAWIKQPPNYGTIGFKGLADLASGAISGTVDAQGCSSFAVNRL